MRLLLLGKRIRDGHLQLSRLILLIVLGLLDVRERSLRTNTRGREDLSENHAPGHAETSARNIDARCEHHATLDALSEHLLEVVLGQNNRVTLLINRVHPDLAIPDRDLHAERRRILAVRNPLAIHLLNAGRENRLHRLAQNSLGLRLTEPLARVAHRMLDELLLKVQEEVVERTDIAVICAALLCIRVTTLQRREKAVTTLALLVLADDDTGGVVDARNADLQ